MLWHTIFDFMLPLYNFMRFFNGPDTRETHRFYVRSDGVWGFHSLMQIFSTRPVEIVYDTRVPTLFQAGVMGSENLERNIDPKRKYDENSELLGCWADAKRCLTLGCQDLLRDQRPMIELDTFDRTWGAIVEDLKRTIMV
jgi:hypothetical protein